MPTLTDLLNGEQPTQGTLEELTAPAGIRPIVKEPGYIDTALTGVVQGGAGLISGAGAATEWAGDVTGSVGIRNAGKSIQGVAQKVLDSPVAKLEGPSFEGTFMENPNVKKAVQIVGQSVPSLAAAMATGGGTAVGLRGLGVAAPKALAAGSAVAAGGLGLIEGAPQYIEAKKAGKSTGEASAAGVASTIGTAALEYLGLGSLLKMAGKGAIKGAGKGIVTEGLQEGSQQFWQNLVAKVGYDKGRSLFDGMAEAVIGGAGAGGIVGAVSGRQTALKDRATEQMLTKVLKAPTTVDNGIATAQTANGTIKAPVDIIAQVVAAGVTPDELATANAEINRGVAEVTKKTTINRLPDDPSLPNAVIYNVKGKEYAYAPKDGMSRDELLAGLEGKSPGAAFNWLKKNSVQVKLEDVNAPTPNTQATPVNEPVQTVQPGPEPVVDSAPVALEREQQILNEEINDAINTPSPVGPGDVPAAVTRDIGEAAADAQVPEPAIDPNAGYDSTDARQTGVTEPVAVQPPSINQGAQNETAQASLLEPQATPSASVSAPTRAPQGVTSKKVPKAFARIAKEIDTVIKEDGVSDDYKRVPSFEAIAAYREKYPDDSPETAMSELAWMPEAEYAALTAPQDEMLFSQTQSSGTTTAQVEQELKDFFGDGYDNLVRRDKLEVIQGVEQLPEAGVPLYTKTRKIAGVYEAGKKKVVLVADNIKPGDARYVMLHEGAHALLREDKVFVKQKDSILSDFEALATTDDSVRAALAKVPGKTPAEIKVEEGLAYWLQEKSNHQHSLFKRVISAIKAALYRLGIAPGRLSASDMSALFTQGTQAWARQGEMSVSEFAQDALLSVKDAGRKIQNLPAFKKWFAGSKVVDSEGRPLVVYHGTNSDFKAFNAVEFSREGDDLIFLSPSAKVASAFALYRSVWAGANVIPGYARMENPLVVEGNRGSIRDAERKFTAPDMKYGEDVREYAKRLGHDGIIFKNVSDQVGPEYLPSEDVYAVFSPTQIKSIFNDKWDGSNPDILFSRIDDTLKAGKDALDTALTAIQNPKRRMHSFWLQHADKVFAITPLSHLAQTYGKTIHWIKDISNYANELEATTTRLIDDFYAIHERAKEAAEKEKPGGVDLLNEAMYKATFHQMDPTKTLMEQDWVSQDTTVPAGNRKADAEKAWKQAGLKKATGLTFAEAHKEAVDAYKALGPKTQKEMVNMAQYLGKLRNMDRDSSMAFIKSVSKEGTPLRTSLMSQFNTSFSTIKGMYFPLSRYGRYVLKFKAADGRDVSENFETYREMDDARLRAAANGADPDSISMQVQDEIPQGSVAVPPMLLNQLRESITKQYMAGVDLSDKVAKKQAEDRIEAALTDFNQIALRWLPDTAALKNSIRRKSTLGANPNMLRSVNGYVQRHAGKIAWSTVGKKIEKSIEGFAAENKERSKNGNVNLVIEGHLLNTMRKWLNAVHKERIGKIASIIGKFNTGFYMTSPSTFLVQLTQLPTLTLPHLAARYNSIPKALAAVKKGATDAFSKKFTKDAMLADSQVNAVYDAIHRKVGYEDNHPTKDVGDDWYSKSELIAEINKLSDDQKKLLALRESEALNLLDISAVHESLAEAQGKRDTKFGTVLHYALMPMKYGELGARKAAILATYDLATAEGKNFFAAMEDTRDVIDKTIYNFSNRDKGWLMQKSIMRIPFTFQTYRIKTALRIGLLMRDSIRAMKEQGLSKGVQDAATKEFVGVMMTSAMLAGTLGVPFAGTLIAILNLVLGDDDEPVDVELMYTNWLREQLGETAGDVAATGIFSLLGVDLSNRIGMGDMFGMQSEPPENLHGAGLAAWWAGNLIGPTFSVVQGGFRGYDEIVNKGNYLKGLEVGAPKPLKDLLKSIRIGTEGLKTGQGKRLLADEAIGPDEIILVALGFNADEIAKAQTAERSLQKLSTKISERRGQLIRQAAQAFVEGDDASPALEKIRKFNQSMPAFGIGGGDIRPAIRKILTGDLGTTGPRESQVASQFEVPDYVR